MPKIYTLEGQEYGELTVLHKDSKKTGSHTRWICKCSCGNTKSILQSHLLRGNIRSCGCLLKRKGADHPNSTAVGELTGAYWAQIKSNATRRMRRKLMDFSITQEEAWLLFLKQNRKCALSGSPIGFNPRTASLDRIDSSKGYRPDNIQWVHRDINFMKGTMEQNEFVQWCQAVANSCEIDFSEFAE